MADRFPLIVNASSLRIQEIDNADNLDLSGVGIKSAGDTNVTSLKIAVGNGQTTVISSARELQNIVSLDAVTTSTIETAIANTPNDYDDLAVTGISTLGSATGVGTVTVGLGNTALLVDGAARVTGILTVGTSTLTLDGVNNQVVVGAETTIESGQVTVGVSTVFSDYILTGIGSIGSNAQGTKTVSTSGPSGGNDGDVWYRYST